MLVPFSQMCPAGRKNATWMCGLVKQNKTHNGTNMSNAYGWSKRQLLRELDWSRGKPSCSNDSSLRWRFILQKRIFWDSQHQGPSMGWATNQGDIGTYVVYPYMFREILVFKNMANIAHEKEFPQLTLTSQRPHHNYQKWWSGFGRPANFCFFFDPQQCITLRGSYGECKRAEVRSLCSIWGAIFH